MSNLLDILLGKSDGDEGGLPGVLRRAGIKPPSPAPDGLQDKAFSPELRRKRAAQREALARSLARSENYTPDVDEDPRSFTGEGVKTETSAWDVYKRWLNNYFEGTSLYRPTSQPAPSLHDVLTRAISAGGEYAGLSDRGAQQVAEKLSLPAELFAPGIGSAVSADESKRAFERGDYGEAALDAVGAIPDVGPLAKLIAASILMASRGGKVVKGLAMDEASRMARQPQLGFQPHDWYHGTANEFAKFSPKKIGSATGSPVEGFSFASSPELASDFAEHAARRMGGGAPQVIPARLKWENAVQANAQGRSLDPRVIAATLQKAVDEGHDALILQNVQMQVKGKPARVSDVAIVIRPDQIRSIFAKFDPKKASSGDLLATLAGAGLLIPIDSSVGGPGDGGD